MNNTIEITTDLKETQDHSTDDFTLEIKEIEDIRHNQASEVNDPIDESLKISTPAWPLQFVAAVNPFWFKRDQHFYEVTSELESILHQPLFMPFEYYEERYNKGEISRSSIDQALELAGRRWKNLPKSADDMDKVSRSIQRLLRQFETFAESYRSTQDFNRIVINEVGKYAAAYFDDQQALSRFPWQSGSFWEGWFEAQRFDSSMKQYGIKDFGKTVSIFKTMQPREAIEEILKRIGLISKIGSYVYMQRLLATNIGWASQFKYLEWQRSLGYEVSRSSSAIDFLAIRMIYDYAIFEYARKTNSFPGINWVSSMNEARLTHESRMRPYILQYVWQLAFEISYQERVSFQLDLETDKETIIGKYQFAFCIDVRSEMLRRHIEAQSDEYQTIGFAGFFGAPIDYHRLGEKSVGHRLPVLLSPAFSVKEVPKNHAANKHANKTVNDRMIFSYFRNLRKAPFSSFLYVELFGMLSIENMIRRTWRILVARIKGGKVPMRFNTTWKKPDVENAHSCKGDHSLSIEQKTDQAAKILESIGLIGNLGELVFLCGHGAETSNNAFRSSLDCGACGGHAGDINARVVVDLLNDPNVRTHLDKRGIVIPDSTWFVAGIHETVTDKVYILDEEKIPQKYKSQISKIKSDLEKATDAANTERFTARSSVLDPDSSRRSANWAEVRPEWGLSGNACFIVAPRVRTKSINLSSRSFLHDYDWSKDKEYKTLELIMTAPMIVTNWINMQYYGSVVAPQYYGSGNKVLHNLTGETGVVEGNGGDLRVGLPIQSVHDGEKFIHDPLRLTVFIEAPEEEIEKIISNHEMVRELLDNEWLHLIHINPQNLRLSRRLPGGIYKKIR